MDSAISTQEDKVERALRNPLDTLYYLLKTKEYCTVVFFVHLIYMLTSDIALLSAECIYGGYIMGIGTRYENSQKE